MPQHNLSLQMSGIRDNHHRGTVGDFLKDKIKDGSKLSIVSAYFTIYAFEALKEELAKIERLEFLFGEPRFVSTLDPDKVDKKAFKIEDDGLRLQNRALEDEIDQLVYRLYGPTAEEIAIVEEAERR